MGRKRYTPEQIISMLREAEVIQSKGQTVIEACRKLGISEQIYYRWRKDYGGMRRVSPCLTHLAPMGIGVKAVVADHDLTLVRNMRGDSGDKLQIIQKLSSYLTQLDHLRFLMYSSWSSF